MSSGFGPGIARTVEWLQGHGFQTTDSGDGRTKISDGSDPDALHLPHVNMRVDPAEMVSRADLLKDLLLGRGILVAESGAFDGAPEIVASYDPANGVAVLMLLGVDDALLFASPEDIKRIWREWFHSVDDYNTNTSYDEDERLTTGGTMRVRR